MISLCLNLNKILDNLEFSLWVLFLARAIPLEDAGGGGDPPPHPEKGGGSPKGKKGAGSAEDPLYVVV